MMADESSLYVFADVFAVIVSVLVVTGTLVHHISSYLVNTTYISSKTNAHMLAAYFL